MTSIINVFLDDKERELLSMASLLFELQETKTTLIVVAKRMGLTIQRIKKLLEEYDSLNLFECGIKIEAIGKKYIHYQICEYSEDYLQQLFVRKSCLFILCVELFDKSFESLEVFSTNHFISIPTLSRKIKRLKKLLYSYSVTLDLRNSHYFGGKEHRIRHFYFELFYFAYGLTENYLPHEGNNKSKTFERVVFPVGQRIKMMAFIMKQRISEEQYIEEEFNFSVVHDSGNIKEAIIDTYTEVALNLNSDYLRQLELEFFFMYIVTSDVISIDTFEAIINPSIVMNNPYFERIREWIYLFLNRFSINVTANTYYFFVTNLYYHLLRKDLFEGNSQKKLDTNYSAAVGNDELMLVEKKIDEYLASISYLFPDSMFEKEFYYMMIREGIVNSDKDVNICIFSGYTQAYKRIIEDNIKKYSLVPVKFKDSINEKVDLVVSDSYFSNDNYYEDEEILFISKSPSLEEYSIVINKVLLIYEKKKGRHFSDFQR